MCAVVGERRTLWDPPSVRPAAASPLHDAVLGFDAELHVDGHSASVFSRSDMEGLLEKI